MNFKKAISALAALAISASCFAGLTVSAAEGDVTNFVSIDFDGLADGADADTIAAKATGTGGSVSVSGGTVDSTKFGAGVLAITSGFTATLNDTALAAIGSADKVKVKFDVAYGKLVNRAFTQEINDGAGTVLDKIVLDPYGNSITESTLKDLDVKKLGISKNLAKENKVVTFEYTFDYATNTYSCVYGSGSDTATASGTFGGQKVKNLAISTTFGAHDRDCFIDNVSISKVEGPNIVLANYTINYVDGEGNAVKTARVARGEVGTDAAIADSDKNEFLTEDKANKYYFVSEDSANTKIAEDNSTAINVVFRKAEVFPMKVVASIDNIVLKDTTNTFEGEKFDYTLPEYLTDENGVVLGKLNIEDSTTARGEAYKKHYHSIASVDGTTVTDPTITVSYEKYEGEAYFVEGESIEGGTSQDNEVYSNNRGARNVDGKDVFTVPSTGTYSITFMGAVYSSTGSTMSLYTTDAETPITSVLTLTSTNFPKTSTIKTENVELKKGDVVKVHASNSGQGVLDYVLFEKTASPAAELVEGKEPAVTTEGTVSITDPTFASLEAGTFFGAKVQKVVAIPVKYGSETNTPELYVNDAKVDVAKWECEVTDADNEIATFYAVFEAPTIKAFDVAKIKAVVGEESATGAKDNIVDISTLLSAETSTPIVIPEP